MPQAVVRVFSGGVPLGGDGREHGAGGTKERKARMMDPGAGDDGGKDRKGRADRQYHREYVVLRALMSINEEAPVSCGLMDISVGGCKCKMDFGTPEEGDEVLVSVESIGFRGKGRVIRTYYTPTGLEVAIQFLDPQKEVPGKLLQYKIRSHEVFLRGRSRGR